ncbi:hypothetical protein PV325_006582 [Microctonus aethiopoides]|nr:hypothetical protein PV325_006582 [Microctonus aethiopoides]
MLQLRNNKNKNYKSARDNNVCDEDNNNTKSNLIIIDKPPAFVCQSNQYNSNESRRVIELSDQKTKMELRREFRLDDQIQKINNGSAITSSYCSSLHKIINMSNTVYDEKILLPKLPAGTILIKQSNSCSNTKELSKNLMTQKVIEKTIESSTEKMKSVHGPEKIIRNIRMRRNPVRETKKKFDDNCIRPRLLTTKRRGNNDHHVNNIMDKKHTKLSTVPYMNTRSVTKKMYNVGASYQAPTVKDEIEWKEWPIHGMHERPIYHPQMGLAVECIGEHFINLDGCSYQKISQSLKIGVATNYSQHQQANIYPADAKKHDWSVENNVEHSFENCMHESLHSVLAYSVQISMPQYKRLIDNYKKINDEKFMDQDLKVTSLTRSNLNCDVDSSKLQTAKPSLNLKCIKNQAKLQKVLERGSKNTLILLKTSDPSLKNESHGKLNISEITSNSSTSVKADRNIGNENIVKYQKLNDNQLSIDDLNKNTTNDFLKNSTTNSNDEILLTSSSSSSSKIQSDVVNNTSENWLNELISDTAMLYCTAIGIHQDDFVMYLNTLDAKQCINWINSRY